MRLLHAIALALLLIAPMRAAESGNPFAQLEHSFPGEADFFPIGVWLQNPGNAGRYRELGVNFYYGLWQGPTAEQIATLKKHDMYVICQMNDYAHVNLLDEEIVVGWMHRDEPDLAHVYPRDKIRADKTIIKDKWPEVYKELDLDNKEYNGWGMGAHPINDIQADYKKYKAIDKKRPVFLQLSKAVALEGKLTGRGDRSGKVWEYPLYIEGSDVVTFDIYPVAYGMADKLYRVADGIDQLQEWGSGDRPLMAAIEAGFGDEAMANQQQQRAQVWMAINHGANGIFWFVHRWVTRDGKRRMASEKMPLDNAEIGQAVKAINGELHQLAAVINSPEKNDLASATGAELDLGARQHDGATYVFAVERGNAAGEAVISVKGIESGTVDVINEDRSLEFKDGSFSDRFDAFGTHLYKITAK